MPSVTLNKGKYWVGDPKSVLPDWKPSPTCTYRVGAHTFHAFQSESGDYIAALPEALVNSLPDTQVVPTTKKRGANSKETVSRQPKSFLSFETPVVFYEQNGTVYIGTIEL